MNHSAQVTAAAVKAAAGATESRRSPRWPDPDALRSRASARQLLAAVAPGQGRAAWDLDLRRPTAILQRGRGSAAGAKSCDGRIEVPMQTGLRASLNVRRRRRPAL